LDRLDVTERAVLVDEILRRREADLPARLRQMAELGVFELVAAEVEAELLCAEAALAPHAALPPVPLLAQLCNTLRHQVRVLQPSAVG
jgi:octaprenyl-diphosphate synthase